MLHHQTADERARGSLKECEPQCCREMTVIEQLEKRRDGLIASLSKLNEAIEELKHHSSLSNETLKQVVRSQMPY